MKRLDETLVFCEKERVRWLQRQFLGFFQVFGEGATRGAGERARHQTPQAQNSGKSPRISRRFTKNLEEPFLGEAMRCQMIYREIASEADERFEDALLMHSKHHREVRSAIPQIPICATGYSKERPFQKFFPCFTLRNESSLALMGI